MWLYFISKFIHIELILLALIRKRCKSVFYIKMKFYLFNTVTFATSESHYCHHYTHSAHRKEPMFHEIKNA
jgi:hypothetical protein